MKYYRSLFSTQTIIGGRNVDLEVYGIFDTNSVLWKYYILSTYKLTNHVYITPDINKSSVTGYLTIESLCNNGVETESVKSGVEYCKIFKERWESGLNDTPSEERDKKLVEILK